MINIMVDKPTLVLDKEIAKVLNQDWEVYNEKKIVEGYNPNIVDSMKTWEMEYIVRKIFNTHPHHSFRNCRRAINIVRMASNYPVSRTKFLEQLLGILCLL